MTRTAVHMRPRIVERLCVLAVALFASACNDTDGTPADADSDADAAGDAPIATCGDRIVEGDEECEPSIGAYDTECRQDCTLRRCGDLRLDPGESCDPPDDALCSATCVLAQCGSPERNCESAGCANAPQCLAGCGAPNCMVEVRDTGLPATARYVGLADVDGDGDNDVEVNGPDGLCMYTNESEPGVIRFVLDPGSCSPVVTGDVEDARALSTSMFLDIDDDGADERFVRASELWELGASGAWTTTGSGVPDCYGSSRASVDLSHRGRLSFFAGCRAQGNHYFEYTDGQLVDVDISTRGTRVDALDNIETPFAFGAADLSGDGLVDVAIVQDSDSIPNLRQFQHYSGGIAIACGPRACEGNLSSLLRVSDDVDAWGVFMGFTAFWSITDGIISYWPDVGPNRLLSFAGGRINDIAVDRGADVATTPSGGLTISWSTWTWDFDRNGLKDIFLSQTATSEEEEYDLSTDDFVTPSEHRDVFLYQGADGAFTQAPVPYLVAGDDTPQYLDHTTVLPADLDGDGRIELLARRAAMVGSPTSLTVYTLVGVAPSACTLDLRQRFAKARGAGFSLRPDGDHHWEPAGGDAFVHGRPPATIVSPWASGEVRFPSGYVTSFDCGSGHSLSIAEPEWIAVDSEEGQLCVSVDGQQPVTVRFVVRDPDAADRPAEPVTAHAQGDGGWCAEVTLREDEAAMVELDGRYVGHWFSPATR